MGGKKRKHSEDKILKKLKKLEKEIYSRRSTRDNYSDSDSKSDRENEIPWNSEYENSPDHDHDIDVPQTPGMAEEAVIEHLDDEILTLLGDAPKEQAPVGPNIHSDIASRMQDVLKNGLKKEQKDKITEDYPIPGNCPLFSAPILNPEVKAATSDALQKKDASLAARQRQVGTALTALVRSMDILVNEKSSASQVVLKHVSSACRLLCDSHYIDTKLRRSFLISTFNNKLKDTLKESQRDNTLFGEDLPEKLKASKAITKSSQDLKYNKPKPTYKNSTHHGTQFNLNWKHPQPNYQSPSRKPAQSYRSAGAPSSSHHRSRAEVDNRRRTTAPRARGNAHYSHKRRYLDTR